MGRSSLPFVKRFCEEKRGTSNIPGPLLLLNKFPRFRNLVTASQYAPIDLDIGSRYAARDIDSASRYAARDIDSASRYGPREVESAGQYDPREVDSASRYGPREVDSAGQYDPREVDSAGQYDPRDVDITSQYITRDLDDARQYTPRLAPSGNAKVLRDSLYALNNDAFVDTLKAFDTMRDLYQKEAAGRSQHYDPYSR